MHGLFTRSSRVRTARIIARSLWIGQTSFSENVAFLGKRTERSERRGQIRFATMRIYRFVSYKKDNTCTRPEDIASPLKTFPSLGKLLKTDISIPINPTVLFCIFPVFTFCFNVVSFNDGVFHPPQIFKKTLRSDIANYFFKFTRALSGRLRRKASRVRGRFERARQPREEKLSWFCTVCALTI